MPGVAAKKKGADPEGDDLEELKKKVSKPMHWTVYYTSPQSFIITFSYLLA